MSDRRNLCFSAVLTYIYQGKKKSKKKTIGGIRREEEGVKTIDESIIRQACRSCAVGTSYLFSCTSGVGV